MKPRLQFLALVVVLLLASLSASAHEDEQIPTGAPDKLGEVNFEVSCNAAAQLEFNRAVAMLHSFFYPEAGRTFTKVTEIDPACGMGHWGVAMSWWYPLWYPPTKEALAQGAAAAAKARAVAPKTERELDYIAAIGMFYRDFDKLDHKSRALAFETAMERVYRRYPGDREAAAFYALALQATADPNDKTYANQLKSAGILEQLFAEQPNHPGAAHYLIHAYDYPELAPRALAAARRYGRIAPAMPHALHMPSHTFIAVGMWQESIQSNLAAGVAARNLGWSQEELHTMDYLVYAYMQGAQVGAARAVVEQFPAVKVDEKARTLPVDYALAAAPARFLLEQRRWSDATTLTPLPSRFPATQALTYFARALGAVHTGALDDAFKDIEQLVALREGLLQAKQDYWAKQVEVQRETAHAWLAWAKGDSGEALTLMRAAADLEDSTYKHPITPGQLLPARELLGDLLLESRQPERALVEYEASLRLVPNRFNGLYGAAQAAALAGNHEQATVYYSQLLALSGMQDTERPELQMARLYLAKNKGKFRSPAPVPKTLQ
jgi:tetratricopeptide (TPR) repeat protein